MAHRHRDRRAPARDRFSARRPDNSIRRVRRHHSRRCAGDREAAAEATADRTDEEDYLDVPIHDLRRRFAQLLLVDEAMNPRVIMTVGGWSSFEAMNRTSIHRVGLINDAFDDVEVV